MTARIALLRGINVGGRQMIAMAKLCQLMTGLGCGNVRSLLQSGNVVFTGGSRPGARLERQLETEVEQHLGVRCDCFVRGAAEWAALIRRNPFREEATRDPGHLLLMALRTVPEPRAVQALQAAIQGREVVRAAGAHLYIVYPDGVGRSRLTNALIEKKLGTSGTARNWNTVLKLAALVAPAHDRHDGPGA